MTLQECYEKMGANYDEVKRHLIKEERIQKILLL